MIDPGPSISLNHLRDPDKPHPFIGRTPSKFVRGDAGSPCRTCGGGWSLPIHLPPLEGWPRE